MSQPGLNPRRAAVRLLDGVLGKGALLPELLVTGALDRLDPSEKARAQRLVMETLRWMDRADRMLGPFLQRKPDLMVHNVLRLSVVELCVDGAAAHGVVNSAVSMVKADKVNHRASGMVNAVLRKIDVAAWDKLPLPRLPKWLRKPLVADYGKKTVEAMEASFAKGAPLDLTPKGDAAPLAKAVGGTVLPTGSVRVLGAGQVSALAGYEAGDWWVQDAAAAIPAKVLNAQAGERVLDMCAAPGGKTMQLAAARADVVAIDVSKKRMARVRENLERTGLDATLRVTDALEWREALFDAILLDAPCTATGTIRRHPDLPHAKDGAGFPALFALQECMIDHALSQLKPGGRLVFCTCSLLPDEGEIQVEDALKRHKDISVEPITLTGLDPAWATPEGGLRLRPDYWGDMGGMDGFYIAIIRKAS
ncbi:RsmB/NOP family class I SAM-dependent RNA methyltransferase [Profundibacter sp.]|uniref:RsmB/NOP family class I SAM-dependent RNA methyltransferase n=1 Tax=Profundibacter sp. TaxID=3101071 RepID=UPI003D119590